MSANAEGVIIGKERAESSTAKIRAAIAIYVKFANYNDPNAREITADIFCLPEYIQQFAHYLVHKFVKSTGDGDDALESAIIRRSVLILLWHGVGRVAECVLTNWTLVEWFHTLNYAVLNWSQLRTGKQKGVENWKVRRTVTPWISIMLLDAIYLSERDKI